MKKIALILALSLIIPAFISADDGDLNWYTSMDEAQAAAQKEDKPMLLFFTGSDWCPWCVKLVNQVLSKPAFKAYADKELVLVKFDTTRKTPVEAKQAAHNKEIGMKYKIQGLPTIILLSAKGDELGQTGYQDLSPEAYVEHLKAFFK